MMSLFPFKYSFLHVNVLHPMYTLLIRLIVTGASILIYLLSKAGLEPKADWLLIRL